MTIREALHQDWARIYLFFSAIVADGRTYAYPEHLSLEAAQSLWMEQPPGRTVVAVDGGHHRGIGQNGPEPARSRRARRHGQFHGRFAAGRRGVGRSLGDDVLAWARSAGYRGMQFNAVVETNAAAVHLWRALGFQILTTVPEAFDHREHGLVGLHVMFQDLAADEHANHAHQRSPCH